MSSQQKQRTKKQKRKLVLKKIVDHLSMSLSPLPPPVKVEEKEKADTFSVDLRAMEMHVPGFWKKLKTTPELLAHEYKHASGDGLPYTWQQALRYEAATMAQTGLQLAQTKRLLNAVYDAVVDQRVAAENMDAKGMCEEWLTVYPVKPEFVGTTYHLLQIIYKDLFSTNLSETPYEKSVRNSSAYRKLLSLTRNMAAGDHAVETVVEAAQIMNQLSRLGEQQGGGGDVQFGRGDKEVQSEAVEAGLDAGLSGDQLADFVGVPGDKLNETIDSCAEDKVREALWQQILSFKELFSGKTFMTLEETGLRPWKAYSKKIDPQSIARNPSDPRKWREPVVHETIKIEQPGEEGGFTKVILLIDCSGSTGRTYKDKTVISYIKSAAYGLIAYAKKYRIPLVTIAFSDDAMLLANEKDDYLKHAVKLFKLRPLSNTNLDRAVHFTSKVKPDKALIALMTDGQVRQGDIDLLLKHTSANKVVIAVVDVDQQGINTVKTASSKAALYIVKPDVTGKILVQYLDSVYQPEQQVTEKQQNDKTSINLFDRR
jgi:hypothetical protein